MENMLDRSYADVTDDGELRGLHPVKILESVCQFTLPLSGNDSTRSVVRIAVDRIQTLTSSSANHPHKTYLRQTIFLPNVL